MKSLAQVCIVLALITFVLGIVHKFGFAFVGMVSPIGYSKATMILLLFGVNFELLELLKK